MGYLDLIKPYQKVDLSNHLPFFIGEKRVGWIQKPFAEHLKQFSDTFEIDETRVLLSNSLANFDDRSAAIKQALGTLVKQDILEPNPFGPHNPDPAFQKADIYPIGSKSFDTPLASIERYYFGYFGGLRHSVSAVGYVDDHVWLAKRSDQVDFPNMLDHTISGGCSIEFTILETLADEAHDEAGISGDLIQSARTLGSFDLMFNDKNNNIFHERANIFDIAIPKDFTPKAKFSREISGFHLMPYDTLNEEILNKENICLLSKISLIYFLIKIGYISENHKEYHDLIAAFDYDPAAAIDAY